MVDLAIRRTGWADRPALSWGSHLVTIFCGLWIVVGLCIDGWAHNRDAGVESFFTSWHAVLYSGLGATAGWLTSLVRRYRAVPRDYGPAVAGTLLFAAGGLGDMTWHTVFGIEQNLAALLSPTHLLMATGMVLILSSPLRAAWSEPEEAPSLIRFLPALISMALVLTVITFFTSYAVAFGNLEASATRLQVFERTPNALGTLTALGQRRGLATILFGNVVMLAPLLYLARRWRLPFGTTTILFGVPNVLGNIVSGFEYVPYLVVTLIAGLATDGLLVALRPTPDRPTTFRLFATAVPLLLWSTFFAVVGIRYGYAWPIELNTGAIVLTTLSGYGLSHLVVPPPIPRAAQP